MYYCTISKKASSKIVNHSSLEINGRYRPKLHGRVARSTEEKLNLFAEKLPLVLTHDDAAMVTRVAEERQNMEKRGFFRVCLQLSIVLEDVMHNQA